MTGAGAARAAKQRADQLLVDRGLVESRARAQALIMAGKVFSGEARIDKPGRLWPPTRRSSCTGRTIPGSRAAG